MDYKNAKIYKIVCKKTGKQYIDSTTQPLFKRKSFLKGKYNQWKLTPAKKKRDPYFDIMEGGDYYFELIEEYPCQSIKQLTDRMNILCQKGTYINKTRKCLKSYKKKIQHHFTNEYILWKLNISLLLLILFFVKSS